MSSCSEGSATKRILLAIRHDVWNLPLPTFLCGFREFILDPSIQFSTIILPPFVMYCSPKIDQMVAAVLKYTSLVPLRIILRSSSSFISSTNYGGTTDFVHTTRGSNKDILSSSVSLSSKIVGPRLARPIDESTSTIRGAWAFLYSASADVISAWLHPKKMLQWADAMTQFRIYLKSSNMASILEEAILRPLYGGRLWDNLQLLQQWQVRNENDSNQWTTIFASPPTHPTNIPRMDDDNPPKNDVACTWDVSLAAHLMRFATAAYGAEMIKSAIDQDVSVFDLMTERRAIAFHTCIPESDIQYIHVREGDPTRDIAATTPSSYKESHPTLRYFIAVDHSNRAIILALRGTLSISGALVDLQGMDIPFCFGGRAHKGIAELAMAIWDECGPRLRELWDEYDSYDLIVTGHSLGAGAACLLHLLLYEDNKLDRHQMTNSSSSSSSCTRRILCYGFAPPPTYWRDESITNFSEHSESDFDDSKLQKEQQQHRLYQEAVQHCWCYIHDCDCVPFLSVASLRRLAILLDATDNYTEQVWFWNRALMVWGWKAYPMTLSNLLHQTQQQQQQLQIQQQYQDPPLYIPAKFIVWGKRQQQQKSKLIAQQYDPKILIHRNIILGEDMFLHHLPEQYENSLDELKRK